MKPGQFKTFRLAPKGFDPRNASPRELLLYGIPKQPDALTHPKLRLLWEQIAERRPRFIEPKFLPLEGFRRSKVHDQHSLLDAAPIAVRYDSWIKRLIDAGIVPLLWPETSTNWCGAYVQKPATETLRVVAGQWTVPSVSPPPGSMGRHKVHRRGIYV